MNLTTTQSRCSLPVTSARGAVGPGETQNRCARVLQAFSEKLWRDVQCLCGLWSGQFEDFAEHVRQPVRAVETLEHPKCASDLDFFNQQRPLCFRGRGRAHSSGEVFGKPLEAQVEAFDGAFLHIEDIVHSDPVRPRLELAANVELREVRYD